MLATARPSCLLTLPICANFCKFLRHLHFVLLQRLFYFIYMCGRGVTGAGNRGQCIKFSEYWLLFQKQLKLITCRVGTGGNTVASVRPAVSTL